MLSAAQVAQFHAQGFLNGGAVIDHATADVLAAETLRVLADREDTTKAQPVAVSEWKAPSGTQIFQIVNICDASAPFMKLVHNAGIVEMIAQLTQPKELRLWHDQIQYKPAEVGGVNAWHQDSPYWSPIATKEEQVTAWIALDDVDEENGCMSMMPGSHKWGNQIEFIHAEMAKDFLKPATMFKNNPLVPMTCPVKKGHVHFHHALTWHGSRANASGRPRRAIALHFMTDKTLFSGDMGHPMAPFITSAVGEKIVGERFVKVWPM